MTVSVLGPGGYSRRPYGSFAGKIAFVPSRTFVQTITKLGPAGYSRPPYGLFGGKVAFVPPKVADAPFLFGGIGHYLVAQEEARQLARITRTTPRPIDRTTQPTFKPVASPPIAPSAPVINLQAIQNQRAAEQQQAAAQAATIKRRRQEEELLLLVS